MSVLRIFLFGGTRIEHEGSRSLEKPTRGVQALLAYLLLHRHRCHSREVLSGVFWADQDEASARGCLNTAFWRLRRVLEPDGIARGTYLIRTVDGEIGFNCQSDYWLDVAVLERGANRLLNRPSGTMEDCEVEQVEEALRVYTGELLEENYSDWALRERERLRALYVDSLARIMRHHHDRGAYAKGLVCGEAILVLDPLREEIHRDMMRMYLENGQRARAARQYEICRDVLAAELNVEPMEETDRVYAQITGGACDRSDASTLGAGAAPLQPVLQRLRDALRGVEQAREQCQRALQLAERLTVGRKR
jgi:DNA-binding SARP family transcriptional activator